MNAHSKRKFVLEKITSVLLGSNCHEVASECIVRIVGPYRQGQKSYAGRMLHCFTTVGKQWVMTELLTRVTSLDILCRRDRWQTISRCGHQLIVVWWRHIATYISINIGAGYGLVPLGNTPLPELTRTNFMGMHGICFLKPAPGSLILMIFLRSHMGQWINPWHTEAETKWLPFCRRDFIEIQFLEWK